MHSTPSRNHAAATPAFSHAHMLDELGWSVVHRFELPGRSAQRVAADSLGLAPKALAAVQAASPSGLYGHQALALRHWLDGEDTVLATGTGSGKSLVFQAAALHTLATKPRSRVLALYPLRALAEEQLQRWRLALAAAGLDPEEAQLLVGDGVPVAQRPRLLKHARLIVATPDIVHAWLLAERGRVREVRDFISLLSLLVIDEAHGYTAVFGSQSAYVFRRLDHAVRSARGRFSLIAASATMAEPQAHLRALTGRDCFLVGSEHDTSPQFAKTIHVVRPAGTDLISGLGRWLGAAAEQPGARFLAFVESRLQAEHFARVAGRTPAADETEVEVHDQTLAEAAGARVRPYRSGYDTQTRRELVDGLRSGVHAGLVSTSALELGIDLPDLNLGFIVGAPRHATSLHQRLGRFGRSAPAEIFVIADGSPASEALLQDPAGLLSLPPERSSLYLDNPRIQFFHTLCLAHEEGWAEMDQPPMRFASPVDFPAGFLELCRQELAGEVPQDLRALRPSGGEWPHRAFPLRDCDFQFTIQYRDLGQRITLGTLIFAQVLREAYPGAIYWHGGKPYRVRQVRLQQRIVWVEKAKAYFTKPQALPPMLLPNLQADEVRRGERLGDLCVVESSLAARECVSGFTERRGNQQSVVSYPLTAGHDSQAIHDAPRFCRMIESTGVLLFHPALDADAVRVSDLGQVLEEAYTQVVPVDRHDLAHGSGRLRVSRGGLAVGTRFLALYDRTYGSLRLSSSLGEASTLRAVLQRARVLADGGLLPAGPTRDCLEAIWKSSAQRPAPMRFHTDEPTADPSGDRLRVILPGSRGLTAKDGIFAVERVFFSPEGLRYKGRYAHQTPDEQPWTLTHEQLRELPEDTRWGWYNVQTGEVES